MSPDWSFARRPFWLFSHVFAATVIVCFVLLGLWQLDRHGERAAFNDEVGSRSGPPAARLDEALGRPIDELNYQYVSGRGTFVDGELVRVANRTQGGVAGLHVVGLFEMEGGGLILVNRGFVPLDASIEVNDAPAGLVEIEGWLRETVEHGRFGADDDGTRDVVPRLDVGAISARVEGSVAEVWLQLGDEATGARAEFPDPVPLPELNGGPHLSYMGQWFIFATLGVLFYGALLRRTSNGKQRAVPVPV